MQLSAISLALTRVYPRGGGFSPASLFANSEVGAWYDPSDLTTIFQDRAGTTPVTADGQPVGLILDKSKGLALGSEVITNAADRDFSSDTGFWSKGSSATISGGVVNVNTAVDDYPIYRFNFPTQAGYYEFTYTLTVVSGSIKAQIASGTGGIGPARTASGTYTDRIYTPTTTATFGFRTWGPFVGTIDNVSLKPITGNHAVAPSDAARPLYKTDGTYHWLQFDGVDDSMSTAAINLTSTKTASVFSGLVTTDNAGFDGIIQFGSVASGGLWSYFNSLNLEFKAQGASGISEVKAVYTPATKSVVSASINLNGATGAECLSVRKNSSTFSSASVVSGDANLQNGILTVGNATGVYLAGNIYSLIFRGALSTTNEITATETWVNNKTGAY